MNGPAGVPGYRVVYFVDARGTSPIEVFIDGQETKDRKRIAWGIELLRRQGPMLKRPYGDAVRGPLRELRIQSGRKAFRLIHAFHGIVAVIVHAFLKKQDQIPRHELVLAESRWGEFAQRIRRGEVRL